MVSNSAGTKKDPFGIAVCAVFAATVALRVADRVGRLRAYLIIFKYRSSFTQIPNQAVLAMSLHTFEANWDDQ